MRNDIIILSVTIIALIIYPQKLLFLLLLMLSIVFERSCRDLNRTTEEWLACDNKVREAFGLFARPIVETPATGTVEITCIVCQTKFSTCIVLSISCGHQICFYCWENYIS